jgi:hypothetical protein
MNFYLFGKKQSLIDEEKILNMYLKKISTGDILQNEDIENILKMRKRNIRMLLELYNKKLYSYSEYIKCINKS